MFRAILYPLQSRSLLSSVETAGLTWAKMFSKKPYNMCRYLRKLAFCTPSKKRNAFAFFCVTGMLLVGGFEVGRVVLDLLSRGCMTLKRPLFTTEFLERTLVGKDLSPVVFEAAAVFARFAGLVSTAEAVHFSIGASNLILGFLQFTSVFLFLFSPPLTEACHTLFIYISLGTTIVAKQCVPGTNSHFSLSLPLYKKFPRLPSLYPESRRFL